MENCSSSNERVDHNHCSPFIKINVSHGPAQHDVLVPAQSTFGYVKKAIEQKTGLVPLRQKILFRGKEKEDGEHLHEAGVKDKAKVLLLEDPVLPMKEMEGTEEASEVKLEESEETSTTNVEESEEMSKALQAIGEIRAEVDKLSERVSALEVVVNGGTKVLDDEFVVPSELLMRQLLKLDAIQAQGKAKMQRKAEVCRVQNFQDTLDNLKAINSKPFSNSGNA